jgi:hypothetical protein
MRFLLKLNFAADYSTENGLGDFTGTRAAMLGSVASNVRQSQRFQAAGAGFLAE